MTAIFDITLPLTDPVLKFFIILIIILFAPILLDRLKIPHLLGLIIAGAVIGPFGLNLVVRDSGIVMSGTVGLLYIMFQAGIEIDMADFKRNALKSTFLGLTSFVLPMILGTLTGIYILNFSFITSVLLASMFASHTLITYPIVSKLGITKNRAVNITVGSTLITNILALLVLAVVVGMTSGQIDQFFWLKLSGSFLLFTFVVLLVFPIIARWFFKRFDDNVTQYIFVLAMVFLGAVFAQMAGIEGIIGAFLAGLALNRLIPRTSPLMNRIDFVGNSIFIPFFLISVGMLINYKVFFTNTDTIIVAIVMSLIATVGKFIPAYITQKVFKYSVDERHLIFGLSNAQAAATLAAVLIGYNIILGQNDSGEPIRLLNESVLNGTIIMILVTCTIASFVTQKGAQNVARIESTEIDNEEDETDERILIPISNPETMHELINLSVIIKNAKNKNSLFALNVINHDSAVANAEKDARKILERAAVAASATDNHITQLLRYDVNIINAINSSIKEHNITDLILGLHIKKEVSESFLGNLTEGILSKCKTTSFIYKPVQPIATIKRHIVIIPENAEKEIGFAFWLFKVWNIAHNTGARIVFYGVEKTLDIIREINEKHTIEAEFMTFANWDDFLILVREIKTDDNLLIVMSRKNKPSYQSNMINIPAYLNNYFNSNSFILVYPVQSVADWDETDLNNPSLIEPIEKIDELGKTIARLFKRK